MLVAGTPVSPRTTSQQIYYRSRYASGVTIEPMPADLRIVVNQAKSQAEGERTYNTLLTQGRPGFRIQMADVKDVVVESPSRVVFHFKSNENRELPLILGGIAVLPRHFFEGGSCLSTKTPRISRKRVAPSERRRAIC